MTPITKLLAGALALAGVACIGPGAGPSAGTEVGNPILVDLDFAVHDRTGALALTVDTAWLAVERIRLRRADTCEVEPGIVIPGPIAVDLLAAGPPPALTDVALETGDYCRFEVEWDAFAAGLPPGAPAELAGAAIAITGTRSDGTPFVLRSERNDEIRLDGVNGAFTLDEATTALFVGMDLARLFAGVELDAAVVSADGIIYIDDARNGDLIDLFEDNLRAAAELFDDDDDNGELDPGEADADDVLAR